MVKVLTLHHFKRTIYITLINFEKMRYRYSKSVSIKFKANLFNQNNTLKYTNIDNLYKCTPFALLDFGEKVKMNICLQ